MSIYIENIALHNLIVAIVTFVSNEVHVAMIFVSKFGNTYTDCNIKR